MKFLRKTKGCTIMDQIRNEQIRQDLNIYNVNERITTYKNNWIQHVHRKNDTSIVKTTLKYQPQGRRDIGRPIKRYM